MPQKKKVNSNGATTADRAMAQACVSRVRPMAAMTPQAIIRRVSGRLGVTQPRVRKAREGWTAAVWAPLPKYSDRAAAQSRKAMFPQKARTAALSRVPIVREDHRQGISRAAEDRQQRGPVKQRRAGAHHQHDTAKPQATPAQRRHETVSCRMTTARRVITSGAVK